MSIPANVVIVPVSAIPSGALDVVSVRIVVEPTINLIWAATGQPLATMCNTYPMPGWVLLPAVDQTGFVTPDTSTAKTGWSYLITVNWSQSDGTSYSESGSIQVLSDQSIQYLQYESGVLGTASPNFPGAILSILVMPAATYSAIPTPDPNTLYFTY